MSAEPIFSLQGVKKSYAGRLVVDIDQLDIHPPDILAIVGPSGAGKSTLLRMLNFLEYPDSGQLIYDGEETAPTLPLAVRRQVTTVFQRPALMHASVEENIAYGLRLRGGNDVQRKVRDALRRMGLEALHKAPAHSLSGGEAQRVALARAMVIEPRVLLLDEPTANLDPYNIGLIEEVVAEINREARTTVVLVTHNIFQARRLAARVGLLLNGRLVELADSHTFFENPGDPRTRAFVNGEMVY